MANHATLLCYKGLREEAVDLILMYFYGESPSYGKQTLRN